MNVKKAIKIHKKSGNIDILELLWIKIKYNYSEEIYYKKIINQLPKWNYFISDLDGTFFRWMLIQEAIEVFTKFIKNIDIEILNKGFFSDYHYFKELEKDAYNKQIHYLEYINAGLYLIFKYCNLINWEQYINELGKHFKKHQKVNPYRFALKILRETVEKWNYFLFISGTSSYIFDIYLNLLKEFVGKHMDKKYIGQIYWVASYVNMYEKYVYNVWSEKGKEGLLKYLKNSWKINKIIWGMWDTNSDFAIYKSIDKWKFFFVNPDRNVILNLKNKTYNNIETIYERKDVIFKCNPKNIELIDY